jgi:phosphatidylserine/phosphatidylglycerophosphate/cardiolipin synthase-like enzyme
MDRALEIIDAARTDLLLTCQFFPHGPTAKHMARAIDRGARLRAFYNHPMQHRAPLNALYGLAAWRVRRAGPFEFSKHRLPRKHAYLHAKILTSERAALISSHNYMITGVQFGTAEIGLISTDPAFVRELNATLLRQLQ